MTHTELSALEVRWKHRGRAGSWPSPNPIPKHEMRGEWMVSFPVRILTALLRCWPLWGVLMFSLMIVPGLVVVKLFPDAATDAAAEVLGILGIPFGIFAMGCIGMATEDIRDWLESRKRACWHRNRRNDES